MTLRPLMIAAVAWVGAAALVPASAQEPSQTFTSEQFTDEQVGAFVDALGAAALVAEEWAPRIQSAQSQSHAEQLTAQSEEEMIAAIEASGITLEDYNHIFIGAQSDPALAERINTELEERVNEQTP